MSILTVPSTMPYPPGFTGNPYTPNDISKFFDLNWPDHAGMLAQGYSAPGLGGLGQACATSQCADDSEGYCTQWDDSSCTPVTTTPVTPVDTSVIDSNAACGTGWSIVINSAGQPICQQNVAGGALNTPLTPAQAGLTAAQQAALIAATGNSAVSLIRTAAGGPYTVAGTNLVYNPATGALTTAAAVNATATLSTGLASLSPYIPYIIAAIAAAMILPGLLSGGKK